MSMNVIEQAPVDQLPCHNLLVTAGLRKRLTVILNENQLMLAETLQFLEVIIPSVRPGKQGPALPLDSEVELRREFQVNELPGPEITNQKIQLSDCRMHIGPELEILRHQIELRRGLQ